MISNYDIYSCLHKVAESYPRKTAITCQNESVNYSDLYNMVCSLGEGIYKSDIYAGDIIAVIMDNSINMIVTILAILCNHCVVLPIDNELPSERIKMIIDDAKPKLAFCDSELTQNKLNNLGYHGVLIETIPKDNINALSFMDMLENVQGTDGAFCMYTSGTTGVPKGVIINYVGIINHINAKISLLNLNANTKMCLSFNISFVASIWQIIAPILIGANLVLYNKNLIKKPYIFFEKLEKDDIDFVCVTPYTLKSYLEYLKHGKPKIQLENVKYIVLTGEKVSVSIVKDFYAQYENIELINAYGQTECSDDTYHYLIPRENEMSSIPIGKPIPNIYGYILDENYHALPNGMAGELFIGGLGVANGYLNNEELTALKFITLPNTTERLYRTGDIVKKCNDVFVYLGRIDHQVKIRGYRIELEEIETYLHLFPNILEAVAKEVELNDVKIIEAIYTGTENIDVNALTSYLKTCLPDYMIPAKFTQIESFAYTANGKIDRNRSYVSGAFFESENTPNNLSLIQNEIYEVIKSALKKDISIDKDLSVVGIDSITFVTIVISLEETFGFEFDDNMLLISEYPTILDMIKYVERKLIYSNSRINDKKN